MQEANPFAERSAIRSAIGDQSTPTAPPLTPDTLLDRRPLRSSAGACPLRKTVIGTSLPTSTSLTKNIRWLSSSTGTPLNSTITSSFCSLAASAGDLATTPDSRAPSGCGSPILINSAAENFFVFFLVVEPHSQISPGHGATFNQLLGDKHCHVDRNRESHLRRC